MLVATRPFGRVSVIVAAPLVAAEPLLDTVIVYVSPACPCRKFPVCTFVIVRSGTPIAATNTSDDPPAKFGCEACATGKLADPVLPATTARPNLSIQIAKAASSALPPRYVEYSSVDPDAFTS